MTSPVSNHREEVSSVSKSPVRVINRDSTLGTYKTCAGSALDRERRLRHSLEMRAGDEYRYGGIAHPRPLNTPKRGQHHG